MAAVAYPYLGARPALRQGRVRRPHPHLRLVEAPKPRSRRRLPLVGVLALLVAAWFGVGALATPGHASPSSVALGDHSGNLPMRYTVRPGDTLWAIALRIDPSGDPRPVVAELAVELHGRPLEPGMSLTLP